MITLLSGASSTCLKPSGSDAKSTKPARTRQDVFDYIELFYNPKRKHSNNGMLSPIEFERQQKMKLQGV